MPATAARRARRAVRHAGRALHRHKVPAALAAFAAATLLAVGGVGLALEVDQDGGPGRPGHEMMQHSEGWGPMDGQRDHPHPPWEH